MCDLLEGVGETSLSPTLARWWFLDIFLDPFTDSVHVPKYCHYLLHIYFEGQMMHMTSYA